MIRVRTLKNQFYAGYGNVCAGTVIEMTVHDVQIAIFAGRVEFA